MNKKLVSFLMFTAGAIIGSVVTWKVVKTKYEEIAQEEIDSVKEEYTRLMVSMKKKLNESVVRADEDDEDLDEDDAEEDSNDDRDETEMIDYHKIASKYRSSNEEDNQNEEEGDEREKDSDDDEVPYINGPYVISPDDFGSVPGYNVEPLDYFADGILADGWGVQLDIDETIGEDAVNHFGEYDDDVVYVRNEATEIEYEVTRDPRTYAEAVRTNPNPYYGDEN